MLTLEVVRNQRYFKFVITASHCQQLGLYSQCYTVCDFTLHYIEIIQSVLKLKLLNHWTVSIGGTTIRPSNWIIVAKATKCHCFICTLRLKKTGHPFCFFKFPTIWDMYCPARLTCFIQYLGENVLSHFHMITTSTFLFPQIFFVLDPDAACLRECTRRTIRTLAVTGLYKLSSFVGCFWHYSSLTFWITAFNILHQSLRGLL